MKEFVVIEVMNEAMIRTLKDKNENYDIHLKVKEYLKDEAFFFKITKEQAYTILRIVGIKESNLENVYKKLTDANTYFNLLREGKIKENDEKLQVKHNITNYNDIFKKKNT